MELKGPPEQIIAGFARNILEYGIEEGIPHTDIVKTLDNAGIIFTLNEVADAITLIVQHRISCDGCREEYYPDGIPADHMAMAISPLFEDEQELTDVSDEVLH